MAVVETVRGPVDLGNLGQTLMHEHVFVLSTEHVQNYGSDWWDEEAMVARAIDKLNAVYAKGIRTIVDPTVWGLGRDIPRMQRIAAQTPLNIVVATGLYVYEELPQQYAYRGPGLLIDIPEPMVTDFSRDITEGIAGTGVKAAFLKFALETPEPSPGIERIARAIARTHVETGAPITVHTSGPHQTGRIAVRIFPEEGVDLTKVVIGHAGDSNDLDYLTELADTGVLLGMDRFGLDLFNPGRTDQDDRHPGGPRLRRQHGARARRELLHRLLRRRARRGPRRRRAELALRAHHRRRAARPAGRGRHPGADRHDDGGEPGPLLHPGQGRCLMSDHSDLGGMFDMTGVVRGEDGIKRYEGLPRNLVQMFRAAVDRDGAAEAVVETGGGPRLSYASLWDRAARVAGGLRGLGVQRGDRVAIRLGNGVDWVLAFLGAVLADAIVVPVNTRFTEEEANYVVTDSGAAYVFAPGAALPDGDALVVDDAEPSGPAAIFYTSGTTGFPKGAVTSHENFLSNAETCRRALSVDPAGLRTLISVPLFHVTGCNSQLLVALYVGGTAVIMPVFEVAAFLRAIEEERIDTMVTVPAIYWLAISQPAFADVDISRVRSVSYGGAPIAPDLVARLAKAFPQARLGNGFGLTETASVSTFLPHEFVAHADSVGFPAPVCDVRLDAVGPDGTGELLIRGPNVVSGYWNKPEATADTFIDGWLHSGDVARIDDEGLVYLVDRVKDMINRGGENVYCVEVENALAGAPGVYEAAVLGVPDEMMGEKVGAVIVPMPGVSLDVPAVLGYLGEHIADFKVPQYVAVSGTPLPRNPGGKLLKRRLREDVDWAAAFRR